ncbi:RrF2 family transcriptional regulator [Tritonibacter horizontis]|nr:Rrf2 family transcriptional regulator [Tritonibacter horizontis]
MFTDYALRSLMHLGVAEGHKLTTRQIADMHDAKYNHLTKVIQWLAQEGYVLSNRGRSGGLQLAKPPGDIRIGALVRDLESKTCLVDCMLADGGTCPLSSGCGLTGALLRAQEAFFRILDDYTLQDLCETPATKRLLLRLEAS